MTKQKSRFTKFKNKTKNYLLKFLLAQLVVTLISLPILTSWGLPISLAAPIGNLFFSPIITAFLVTSSFLFFTELLGLPNFYLASLLNLITKAFEYCLNLGQKSWLLGFQTSTKIIIIAIPAVTILLIMNKRFKEIPTKIIFLSLSLCILFFSLKYVTPPIEENCAYLPYTRNKLQLTSHTDGTINLIDSGCFNQKQSIEKFINFDITPFIIKKFGNTTIKSLTLLNPGIRSFKATIELCKIFKINCVKINLKSMKTSKYAWKCFYDLKRILIKNNTTLELLSRK